MTAPVADNVPYTIAGKPCFLNGTHDLVGINRTGGVATLHLPIGYAVGDTETENRAIAIELYRALFRFADICRKNNKDADRLKAEGAVIGSSGMEYRPSLKAFPDFSFRLISALRELFSLLRTPNILTLRNCVSPRSGHFDWRQIERQLHRAMYLPDGTPVFESMDAPQPVLLEQAADIVGMACWVARDASDFLFGESLKSIAGGSLASEWESLADEFAFRYLAQRQTLFASASGQTCGDLQHILLEIDRRTPVKSAGYLNLFDLMETILFYRVHGECGDIWATKGFAYAWESICLEYAIKEFDEAGTEIFTCDDEHLDRECVSTNEVITWAKNRKIFFRNARNRRPDLVIINSGAWTVIDIKYYERADLYGSNRPYHKDYTFNKLAQDLDNLEAYRFLIADSMNIPLSNIHVEIWIPGDECKSEVWSLANDDNKWEVGIKQLPSRKLLQEYASKFHLWE